MAKQSAGLMMYRQGGGEVEVFLVHPGGPFWRNKDKGAWGLPKGECLAGEDPLAAAKREFNEETGFVAQGPFHGMGTIRQSGGKMVSAWAFEGDCDPQSLTSNLCRIEWPPRSKRWIDVPEIDRGSWFTLPQAEEHMLQSQLPLLDTLKSLLVKRRQAEREQAEGE